MTGDTFEVFDYPSSHHAFVRRQLARACELAKVDAEIRKDNPSDPYSITFDAEVDMNAPEGLCYVAVVGCDAGIVGELAALDRGTTK